MLIMRRLAFLWKLISSEWRKLIFRLIYGVRFGPGVVIHGPVVMRIFDGGSINIGAGSDIWHYSRIEVSGGTIRIGPRAFLGQGTIIAATQRIEIGSDALVAEYVTIRDSDHITNGPELPYNKQGMEAADVIIGDNVWLAAKVTVVKGVCIGDHAVVGANSVVTRNLERGGRYVGAPARLIQSNLDR